MNGPVAMQSFEAARRRQLIEATIETVSDVGFRAASLSEIARRAGVSQGLFAHYFGDKDGLLEATLRFMAARLTRATAARMRAAATPLERVIAVSESALADEEFDRRTSAVWLAFWGQIIHSAPYRRVQSIYLRRMRSNLRHGLRDLVPPERIGPCAELIGAAIDGLWLQSHTGDQSRDEAGRARAAVRELISILIAAEAASPAAAPAQAGNPFAAWRETPGRRRAEILRELAAALLDESEALARLDAAETRPG